MAAATRNRASATATLLEYGRGPGAQGVRGPQGRGILGMPPETSPLSCIAMALCGCPTPTLTLPTCSSCDAYSRTSGGDEAETRGPGGDTPRQLDGDLIRAPVGPGGCRAKSFALASSRARTREDAEGMDDGDETSGQRQPTQVGRDRRDAGSAACGQRRARARPRGRPRVWWPSWVWWAARFWWARGVWRPSWVQRPSWLRRPRCLPRGRVVLGTVLGAFLGSR